MHGSVSVYVCVYTYIYTSYTQLHMYFIACSVQNYKCTLVHFIVCLLISDQTLIDIACINEWL